MQNAPAVNDIIVLPRGRSRTVFLMNYAEVINFVFSHAAGSSGICAKKGSFNENALICRIF